MAKVKAGVVVLFTLLLLLPIYMMLTGSVETSRVLTRMPPALIPTEVNFASYARLLTENPVARWVGNSALIVAGSVVGGVLFAVLAGYALAMYRFRGRQVIYWAFLAALMLPRLAFIIPQYVVMRKLGLATGLVGSVIPLFCFPMGVILFRLFIEGLPKSIDDAARMDGASEWQTIAYIVLPLCGPAVGVLAITKAYEALGDYLWQSLVLTRTPEKTLLVGMVDAMRRTGSTAGTRDFNPIGVQLAAGTIMFIPLLVIFVIGQRAFRDGLTAGSLKE